ncbi:MAG: hypothetical protein JWO38_1856 [Gemmataceae bacterium]|nr:hypothetical protein [Gemmataceae bacterium]
MGDLPRAPVRPILVDPKAANCPRRHFPGAARGDWVGLLVLDTGGAVVGLETGELLDLKPRRWDVTRLR